MLSPGGLTVINSQACHAGHDSMMDIRDVIYGRRSVRSFAPRSVPDATLSQLIDAAIQAPSAMNEQSWSFHIIRDAALLDEVSSAAKQHLLSILQAESALGHVREMLTRPEFHIFYHAPVVVVIAGPANSDWTTINCTLAAQTFMLGAFAAGIGTCWIGFAQQWLNTAAGRAAIGMSDETIAVAPLAVGYPMETPHAVPRRPPLVHWIGKSSVGL